MIIDSSALLAILQQEPDAGRIARALAADGVRLISAANWLELCMVAVVRGGDEAARDVDRLVATCRIDIVAVTPKHAAIAHRAFARYGKGFHPARLNFGDCFAYALAKDSGEPLLFKGDDFTHTDIAAVPY
jgi:ribonuclease VapC